MCDNDFRRQSRIKHLQHVARMLAFLIRELRLTDELERGYEQVCEATTDPRLNSDFSANLNNLLLGASDAERARLFAHENPLGQYLHIYWKEYLKVLDMERKAALAYNAAAKRAMLVLPAEDIEVLNIKLRERP